jgi:hypothetical protein
MEPDQMQKQILEDTVREGLSKMSPLGAWALEGKLIQMQRDSYNEGIDIQIKVLRDWIQLRREDMYKYRIHSTDYAVGVSNTLVDLEHFLNELDNIRPK